MENQVDKKMRFFGLRGKISLAVILTGLFLAGAVLGAGIYRYQESITDQYTETAYMLAKSVEGMFKPGELEALSDLSYRYNTGEASQEELRAAENGERYQELKAQVRNLRRNMNANGIYICVFNMPELVNYSAEAKEQGEWNPLYYILDTYHVEEVEYSLGDKAPMTEQFIPLVVMAEQTGQRPTEPITYEGNFGYNTVAVYPVWNGNRTVAFINVEIPMTTLRSGIIRFTVSASAAALIVAVLSVLVSLAVMIRTLIQPVRLVAEEAQRFVKSNNAVSTKLQTIKTQDEIQILSESLLKMEIDINEYIRNIKTITAEKERIGAELSIATQIQADMLPRIFPAFPGRSEFDIYATMTPAKEVGGDFYDFFLIDEDHLGLVMADVSGKGVPAALFMVIAKTLIKNRAQMGGGPAEILQYVNEQLCEGNEAELFVTVWFAILEISTGKGLAANAGHEHPVLRRGDGDFELVVYRHSPAVATMEGLRFREHSFELHPGDKLFVYTDGVPEATNADNELYGTDRMLDVLNRNADAPPEAMLRSVKQDIDRFVGDAPQFDDITMLCLRYFGPEVNRMKEMTTDARVENLDEVLAFVDAQLEDMDCPIKTQMQIDVAVEEVFVNIANYAYEGKTGQATVRLDWELHPRWLSITFFDRGIPYDPLAKEDPDITLSAEERKIGGLGIFMVKKSMDQMVYEYKDGQNILCIKKEF